MKRLFTLLFSLLLLCYFISCAPPIGNFGGGANVDFWIIEVVEREYIVGDNFNRNNDFFITSFENGDEIQIYADDPTVKTVIVPNPDSAVVLSREVTEQFFPFSEAGKHEVRVTFKGRTKSYRITVRGILDRDDNSNQSGLGGGIIWL